VVQYQSLTRLSTDAILADLNRALVAERQAVADYDDHARVSGQADIRKALESLRDVEAEHAARLATRITLLGGSPAAEMPAARATGETLEDRLIYDLEGEQWAIAEYARLVAGIVDDDETAGLMAELLMDEIRHAAWLKATLRAVQAGGSRA
jgi:bacterioferritin (cytochrome b1)